MSIRNSLIEFAVSDMPKRRKEPEWTEEQESFVRKNLGYLTDADMGKALGRTETAVRLHWKRDMRLTAPSKAAGILTANQIAKILQVDAHKITGWMDEGFLPGRLMAGGRKIRLIERDTFQQWLLNPDHWMYFDIRRIADPVFRRLLRQAARQWKDEWWSTPRVAKHHRVTPKDVVRYIKAGRIDATHIQYSYGGRHLNRKWSYWFVRKSEATRPDLKFRHNRKARQ